MTVMSHVLSVDSTTVRLSQSPSLGLTHPACDAQYNSTQIQQFEAFIRKFYDVLHTQILDIRIRCWKICPNIYFLYLGRLISLPGTTRRTATNRVKYQRPMCRFRRRIIIDTWSRVHMLVRLLSLPSTSTRWIRRIRRLSVTSRTTLPLHSLPLRSPIRTSNKLM